MIAMMGLSRPEPRAPPAQENQSSLSQSIFSMSPSPFAKSEFLVPELFSFTSSFSPSCVSVSFFSSLVLLVVVLLDEYDVNLTGTQVLLVVGFPPVLFSIHSEKAEYRVFEPIIT